MIDYDIKLWKIPRFEKSEDQIKAIEALFKLNIKSLYNIYVELAAKSSFPEINWLIWSEYCAKL